MKKMMPFLLSLLALTGCGATAQESSYQQISMDEALSKMSEEENYILLDVRTIEEYSNGHIPGAVNLPNESIGENEISELPDKEQLIYVYCRSGNRSKQAASKLVQLGYTNIVEIGGINDYHGEVEK